MKLTCNTCGHTEDYGDVGQTAECSSCKAILDPRISTQDMRLRPDTLTHLRHGGRAGPPTTETFADDAEDASDTLNTDGVGLMTRPVVADRLAALHRFLDANCMALFEAEDYVALRVRLARANRLHEHTALRELADMLDGLATRRVREVELDIARALEAGELDTARTLFALFQRMTDDATAVRRLAGKVAEATLALREAQEAQAIFDDAQRFAREERPLSLKQALKRFQMLIDGWGDRFSRLPVSFDRLVLERDRVQVLLEQAEGYQNIQETAVAIAMANKRVDEIIQIRKDYAADLENGRLDPVHVQDKIVELTDSLHAMLDGLVTDHLDEIDRAAGRPEYAEDHLRRLEQHREHWKYLSDPVRHRAESAYARVAELVERRKLVRDKTRAAQKLIESNHPVEAIRQLQLLSGLHGDLELDLGADIQLAVGMIARRASRLADGIDEAFDDDAFGGEDIERTMAKMRAEAERLEEVAEVAPQVEPVLERLLGGLKRGRGLLKSIERTRRALVDIERLIDEGHRGQAKQLLDDLERPESGPVPAQCRDEVDRLRKQLDIARAVDAVAAELEHLAATDRARALEHAMAHADDPACRAFIAQHRFEVAFQEVAALEEQGEDRAALARASELARSAPPELRDFARAEFERLTRVEQHAAWVHDILEAARQAEAEGRLDQIWTRFDEKLEVGRSLRQDWQRLRTAAIDAASTSLRAKLDQALQMAQAARARWMAESGLDDEPLYVRHGIQDPGRAAARAHLDEALEAVESVKLDAEFLRKRERESIPRELVHLIDSVDVEARLCGVEDRLDRADFAEARALLPDSSEPRWGRCRARIERLEFGWRFVQAILALDEDTARALLEAYPAERAAERARGAELLALLQVANDALGHTAASVAARLDRVRKALIAVEAIPEDRPDHAVLAPMRGRLEDALVRLVRERFDEFNADRLPGAVFLQFELLRQLLMRDALRARPLVDMQRVVAPRLQPGAETLLTWLDRHRGALERLPTDEIKSLQERLGLMRDAMFGTRKPDDRFVAAMQEVEAAWARANEQKDARERRDALVAAAIEEMDIGKLREAADLEREGGIADKRAHQMVRSWGQAEKLVEAIEEALSRMRFDDLEAHLGQLEHLDVPHRDRATFRHPVIRGRSLSSGAAGIREILDDLRAESRQRRAEREQAVIDKEARIEAVRAQMQQVACECPSKGGADAIRAYVQAVAPALIEGIRTLRGELQRLGSGAEAGERTVDTVDSLLQKLPPTDPREFVAALHGLCARFLEDYDYLLKLSAGSSNREVVAQRAHIEEIERRWRGCNAPALGWLIRDLSRAWRPRA